MPEAAPQKCILIVDDTPINIGMISGALKDSYKTKVATNGEKALSIATGEEKPDLILLDVMMPVMDGYEVCRRLKVNSDTRDIPVIFLTGQTGTEDETKGFEVGAVDYIHKPFSEAVVKARVHTHLMLREAHAQIARQLLAINMELEMARQIQLSILPRSTPKIQGLEIVARYLPMTSVAGDFYDFIVVDEKHVGILVADVSGHGLPSALIASMLQVALTAQAGHASDPARVLSGLNQALCGKFELNFVTAAYVYVDMEKKLLTYAGAGHRRYCFGANPPATSAKWWRTVCFSGCFPKRPTRQCKRRSRPGTAALYIPTEFRKRRAHRRKSLAPRVSSDSWRATRAWPQTSSRRDCWTNCAAGRSSRAVRAKRTTSLSWS